MAFKSKSDRDRRIEALKSEIESHENEIEELEQEIDELETNPVVERSEPEKYLTLFENPARCPSCHKGHDKFFMAMNQDWGEIEKEKAYPNDLVVTFEAWEEPAEMIKWLQQNKPYPGHMPVNDRQFKMASTQQNIKLLESLAAKFGMDLNEGGQIKLI